MGLTILLNFKHSYVSVSKRRKEYLFPYYGTITVPTLWTDKLKTSFLVNTETIQLDTSFGRYKTKLGVWAVFWNIAASPSKVQQINFFAKSQNSFGSNPKPKKETAFEEHWISCASLKKYRRFVFSFWKLQQLWLTNVSLSYFTDLLLITILWPAQFQYDLLPISKRQLCNGQITWEVWFKTSFNIHVRYDTCEFIWKNIWLNTQSRSFTI